MIPPAMFTLKDVVPWGRSFDEYRGMFSLWRRISPLGYSAGRRASQLQCRGDVQRRVSRVVRPNLPLERQQIGKRSMRPSM